MSEFANHPRVTGLAIMVAGGIGVYSSLTGTLAPVVASLFAVQYLDVPTNTPTVVTPANGIITKGGLDSPSVSALNGSAMNAGIASSILNWLGQI